MEEHMWRKDEKRDEASFLQVKMNIPVIRDCGALNSYLCYLPLFYTLIFGISVK